MPSAKQTRPLRLGTRSSPLAMAQAQEAKARLISACGLSDADVEIFAVKASGDKVLDRPLAEIGGKALWTKELDAALLEGEIDFAVHSAKDVETIRPDAIVIGAVLPREDVRDVLVGAPSIAALAPGAIVGTSAPRRAAQLLNARPDCKVVPIRGNVATRLSKLAAGEADATFLAAAGLKRLRVMDTGQPLDAREWLPAPGQGAIAIECRADDERTCALLCAIDDRPSREALLAERALLAALGGNCHSSIGVLTQRSAEGLHIRAAIFSPDGTERVDAEAQMAANDHDAPRRLAEDLLSRASRAITAHFSGPEAGAGAREK
ncbi:MAG: hydroxymethylbilane synthase [Sphingomonadaceae bacterium]|nr:hydroxymethylbilane synthase [Sphingomonadaceae bacterium]